MHITFKALYPTLLKKLKVVNNFWYLSKEKTTYFDKNVMSFDNIFTILDIYIKFLDDTYFKMDKVYK